MYISDAGRGIQRGSFPLKGRKPEQVAYEWIHQIKRESTFRELLKVEYDEGQDITEIVTNMLNQPLDIELL